MCIKGWEACHTQDQHRSSIRGPLVPLAAGLLGVGSAADVRHHSIEVDICPPLFPSDELHSLILWVFLACHRDQAN